MEGRERGREVTVTWCCRAGPPFLWSRVQWAVLCSDLFPSSFWVSVHSGSDQTLEQKVARGASPQTLKPYCGAHSLCAASPGGCTADPQRVVPHPQVPRIHLPPLSPRRGLDQRSMFSIRLFGYCSTESGVARDRGGARAAMSVADRKSSEDCTISSNDAAALLHRQKVCSAL